MAVPGRSRPGGGLNSKAAGASFAKVGVTSAVCGGTGVAVAPTQGRARLGEALKDADCKRTFRP